MTEQKKERIVKVTRVYQENEAATEPVVVNVGGARSSKSYSIAQLMVRKFANERNKSMLTTRKTFPALRRTAYKVALDMMKDYGYYPHFGHNKSYHEIYNRRMNNTWYFTSIDNPERIKSTEYNYIHMEEANEFNYDDYMILKLRLSGKEGKGERNRMYISFNPSEKYGWLNTRLIGQGGTQVIRSTYLDAIKFLPQSYVERLEALKEEDESYWLIYGLGEFAELKGLIHKIEMVKGDYPKCKETIYGLDFGFTNPMALARIDVDMESLSLYLTQLIYKTGQTTPELIEEMRGLGIKKDDEIYCDSAEPDRIEEIYKNGFNAKSSDKGKNSVVNGIDFLNRFKLYSKDEFTDMNREMRGYKRKVDKAGHVREEPVKFEDHFPNGIRYAAYTHLRKRFLKEEAGEVYHGGLGKSKGKPKDEPEDQEYGEVGYEGL